MRRAGSLARLVFSSPSTFAPGVTLDWTKVYICIMLKTKTARSDMIGAFLMSSVLQCMLKINFLEH